MIFLGVLTWIWESITSSFLERLKFKCDWIVRWTASLLISIFFFVKLYKSNIASEACLISFSLPVILTSSPLWNIFTEKLFSINFKFPLSSPTKRAILSAFDGFNEIFHKGDEVKITGSEKDIKHASDAILDLYN